MLLYIGQSVLVVCALIALACSFLEVVLDAVRQSAGCGSVHWVGLVRLVRSTLCHHAVSGVCYMTFILLGLAI